MPVKVKSEPVPVAAASSSDVVNVAGSSEDMAMTVDDDDVHEASKAHSVSSGSKSGDDEDEVVREIDVFLSPELAKQMYLIQYPLHQNMLATPTSARIKPRHCMLEVDFPQPDAMDQNGAFFLNQRTYTSQTIPVSTHMTLGKLQKDGTELHLVPLQRISQMRPSFHHVDEHTSNTTATSEEDAAAAARAEAARMDRKPLNFQKRESERAAMMRKSSYSYKKSSEESEMWYPLEVCNVGSVETDDTMKKVLCSEPDNYLLRTSYESGGGDARKFKSEEDDIAIGGEDNEGGKDDDDGDAAMANDSDDKETNTITITNADYIQSLNYQSLASKGQSLEAGGGTNDEDEEGIDASNANVTAVCTKCVKLMYMGLPIPYSILRARFSTKYVSDDLLLDGLVGAAFLSMEVVYRSRLNYVYKDDSTVTPEAIHMLLKQVGCKTKNGWKLKVEDDPSIYQSLNGAKLQVFINFWRTQVRRFDPLLKRYTEVADTIHADEN